MSKKTKIFTTGFVLILGAILLSGAGCVQKAATLTGHQLTNEDKCAELMAQSLTGMQSMQSGDIATATVWQEKIDNLKKQYGWSDEDITNNCKTFSNQKGFMDRVGKRMQELLSEIK